MYLRCVPSRHLGKMLGTKLTRVNSAKKWQECIDQGGSQMWVSVEKAFLIRGDMKGVGWDMGTEGLIRSKGAVPTSMDNTKTG